MPNLLSDASKWTDEAGSSPPSYWNGTAYEFLTAYADTAPSMTATAAAGDTVEFAMAISAASTRDTALHVSVNGTDVYTNDLQTLGDASFTSSALSAGDEVAITFVAGSGFSAYDLDVTLTPPVVQCNYNCECDDASGNRTLKELRDDLARRLGYGAQVDNLPPGMTDLLNSFLQGAQRALYRRYDVLRTERFYTWNMTAGTRYYDLADNRDTCTRKLDPRKITWAGVSQGCGDWTELRCGINPLLYSNEDMTGRPERYEIRQCIEVWPAPADESYQLRLKGHFGLDPFVADTDATTVDDELVFLLALANAKAHYGKPDANNYIQQLETMMLNLVAGAHNTRRYVPGRDDRCDMVYTCPVPLVPFE